MTSTNSMCSTKTEQSTTLHKDYTESTHESSERWEKVMLQIITIQENECFEPAFKGRCCCSRADADSYGHQHLTLHRPQPLPWWCFLAAHSSYIHLTLFALAAGFLFIILCSLCMCTHQMYLGILGVCPLADRYILENEWDLHVFVCLHKPSVCEPGWLFNVLKRQIKTLGLIHSPLPCTGPVHLWAQLSDEGGRVRFLHHLEEWGKGVYDLHVFTLSLLCCLLESSGKDATWWAGDQI